MVNDDETAPCAPEWLDDTIVENYSDGVPLPINDASCAQTRRYPRTIQMRKVPYDYRRR